MSEHEPTGTEELNRAVGRWNSTVGERLLRSLSPIYKEGPRHPELIGSGVLLRVADLTCLITAAHVADQVKEAPHYFGAADLLIPLGGLKMTSPLQPGTTREEDRTDLAYWVLEPATAKLLSRADTLAPGDLDLDAQEGLPSGDQYFVNGYPVSRQPRRLKDGEFAALPFSFVTEEKPVESYEAIDLDRKQNLFVSFEKGDTFRDGDRVTGPDLFGVSGGALWRLSGGKASLQEPKLAGVVVSWRRDSPTGIIATRVRLLAHAIASEFPHTLAQR